jgi:hypothetical protein
VADVVADDVLLGVSLAEELPLLVTDALDVSLALTELLTLTLADSDCTTGGRRKDGHKGGAETEGEREAGEGAVSGRQARRRIVLHHVA